MSVTHSRVSRNLRERLRTVRSETSVRNAILPQSEDLSSETVSRAHHNERLGVSKKPDRVLAFGHPSRRRWRRLTRALIERSKRHLSNVSAHVKSIAEYCTALTVRTCRMLRYHVITKAQLLLIFRSSPTGDQAVCRDFITHICARTTVQLLQGWPFACNIIKHYALLPKWNRWTINAQ
jgi:hypothetical protein